MRTDREEAEEISRQVQEIGYCICWSTLGKVAFAKDDVEGVVVPKEFPVFTIAELDLIFRQHAGTRPPWALLIEAKREGAKVVQHDLGL